MKPEDITKYMTAVGDGFTNLALKLKQPAEQVYGLFLRQNYVQAFVGLFQLMVFFVIVGYFIKFLKWGFVQNRNDSYNHFEQHEGWAAIAWIGGIILGIVALVVFFGGIEYVVSRFVNPNYMTITDIINLVKPK